MKMTDKMIIQPARRTASVREYYFSRKLREIDALNAARQGRGEPRVINLGIGAPDGMPPQPAIEALVASAREPGNHAYQSYVGLPALREAFARWYARYYGVTLDPSCEIQPLVGSKEGILLISMAFVDPGDKVLVPDPGYPTYSSASRLVEAEIIPYDLREENGWWPDFDALERMDLRGVKLMWTNYPHMPTGAKASPQLYDRLAAFARDHGILVAGWRIGMVAGAKELVAEVLKVKSQMDSGMFKPLQLAAVEALSQGPEWFDDLNREYARRRVEAGRIFDALGVRYDAHSAGLFLWGRVPGAGDGERSAGEVLSDRILGEAGVFITPGFIFGKNGRSYLRISLCARVPVLQEARERIVSKLHL